MPDVPDVPPLPQVEAGGLVAMDAAMLAAQTEHIKRLTDSIQQLAVAVRERPTKREIQRQRRRTRLVGTAMFLIAALLFGWLFIQNNQLKEQCRDRNDNAAKFRILLEKLLNQPAQPDATPPTPQQVALNQAFVDYKNSLVPIDC